MVERNQQMTMSIHHLRSINAGQEEHYLGQEWLSRGKGTWLLKDEQKLA